MDFVHTELADIRLPTHNLASEVAELRAKLQVSQVRVEIRERELALLRCRHEQVVSALNAAGEGLLAIRTLDRSFVCNRRFGELWGIPATVLAGMDAMALLECMLSRVAAPQELLAQVERHRQHPEQEELGSVQLLDGRTLERHMVPQWMRGQCVGRVVIYREIQGNSGPAAPQATPYGG